MNTRDWARYRTFPEFDFEPKAVFGVRRMMEQDPNAWEEGLKAGEERKTQCPYAEGSREAWSWSSGWVEGDAKRQGFSYSRGAKPKEPERGGRVVGLSRRRAWAGRPKIMRLGLGLAPVGRAGPGYNLHIMLVVLGCVIGLAGAIGIARALRARSMLNENRRMRDYLRRIASDSNSL